MTAKAVSFCAYSFVCKDLCFSKVSLATNNRKDVQNRDKDLRIV